jgi:methionyl-tRNA formyltransferase
VNILLSGKKYFGSAVFSELIKIHGVEITAISSPIGGDKLDQLTAKAGLHNIKLIPSGTLNASTMPDNIDLIVAAHSHDFIGEKTRLRARYGGIGYHPSLLPLHRGRDAVSWSIKMRERVTGGTVYRLSNKMDGGNILAQSHIFIKPDDTVETLWRNTLAPLGVELLAATVSRFLADGYINGTEQDESVATFEPSIDRLPIYKPDLIMICNNVVNQ